MFGVFDVIMKFFLITPDASIEQQYELVDIINSAIKGTKFENTEILISSGKFKTHVVDTNIYQEISNKVDKKND